MHNADKTKEPLFDSFRAKRNIFIQVNNLNIFLAGLRNQTWEWDFDKILYDACVARIGSTPYHEGLYFCK